MAIIDFSVEEALVSFLIFSSRRMQAANSLAGFTSSDATYMSNAVFGSACLLVKYSFVPTAANKRASQLKAVYFYLF